MSWQSTSTSPGLGFEIRETCIQLTIKLDSTDLLPGCCRANPSRYVQPIHVANFPSGILWLSLLRISALSAWTTLFFALEQAGGTNRQRCRAANLPSMPPGAQEEGCPSRSRSASRPCGLQNFTENVLHHLASVAQSTQSNFLVFVMPVWFELQTFGSNKH